jgi:phage shock protein PspC (stress-responsive transcriptional regulator)
MKKLTTIILLIATQLASIACPVCERNQPKILRGIVHGAGPQNNWDYLSVSITIIIALITLFYTIKWLIKPGEKNINHIKYSIIK